MPKKKEFHEEFPTKACPECGYLCMEEAEVCDECGYSFVPHDEPSENPTPEESEDIEALFQELESTAPGEESAAQVGEETTYQEVPIEEPIEQVEQPIEQEPTWEEPIPDEPEEVIEEPVNDILTCPNCGSEVDPDALHCPVCGTKIQDGEVVSKALLESLTDDYSLVPRGEISYENAIPGEELIIRKVGNTYEALTCPEEMPVKIIEASDSETDFLKADYTLRKDEVLTTKKIVAAGGIVKNNPDFLSKYYGTDNIDDIYGEGLSEYANLGGVSEELLNIGLSISVLEILSDLTAKEQTTLGGIMNRYNISDITPTTAKLLVDSDKSEDTLRDITVRDMQMQSIIADYISRLH